MDYKGLLKQINATTLRLKTETKIFEYKGFTLSEIPKTFGFIYDENEDTEGINKWFNYKGLTYILTKVRFI
tara:strand:- start:1144 stop:1356 length:213 start_codon:yes stop_codon:yes gene_type:complete